MSQTLELPPPGFDSLSIEEQIDYVQSLWNHISARPEEIPVPDWHKKILAERVASHRSGEGEVKLWDEFEGELTEELDRQLNK